MGSLENSDLGKLKVENTSKKERVDPGVTAELWTDVEKCLWIGILEIIKFSGK